MSPEKRRRTFISYSRTNKEFALKLALELRSSGFDIWLDQLDIPTGSRWDDEVEKALEECEIFMVILTPASSMSDNVKDEIGYAIDTGKRILPVLLENARVPLRLIRFQYVDFTAKNYEEGIESAKQLLRKLIEEPTIPREQIYSAGQVQEAEANRKEKEEAERLAKQKAEDERLAREKAQAQRFADQDAERLNAQKAEADRKEKEEAERLAKQKAEDERLAHEKAQAQRLADQEAERVKAQQADADRKAKEKAAQLATQKAEDGRLGEEAKETKQLAAKKAMQETERVTEFKVEKEKYAEEKGEGKASTIGTVPVPEKHETLSTSPIKKSKMPLILGGVGAGVLVVVAFAVIALMNRSGGNIPNTGAPDNQVAGNIAASPAPQMVAVETTTTVVPTQTQAESSTLPAASPETPACQTPDASVNVSTAYLRNGPDLRFASNSQYKSGDDLTVMGRYQDWFLVEASDSNKGWLYKDWIALPSDINTSDICLIPEKDLPRINLQQDDSGCVPTYYGSCD